MAVSGQQGYYNGSTDGGAIGAWVGTGTQQVYIGGLNNNGVLSQLISGNIQATAIYSTTLTASQVAAVSAAMAAL
jgi:hypothetical protein